MTTGNNHLHIFRNTPYGRETFLQTIYFAKKMQLDLDVHIPETKKFLFYFEQTTVEVDLDGSYYKSTETARAHAEGILNEYGYKANFLETDAYTASNLPDLPSDYAFMTCPRVISDLSTKIGLGHIGSKVRDILRHAPFPVLIPSQVFKPWQSVTVLFNDTECSLRALRMALKVSEITATPLDIFTQAENDMGREAYRKLIVDQEMDQRIDSVLRKWYVYDSGDFIENLYDIPHDALIVMGIYGGGTVKNLLLGSTAENVQSAFPNSLLLTGPELKRNY